MLAGDSDTPARSKARLSASESWTPGRSGRGRGRRPASARHRAADAAPARAYDRGLPRAGRAKHHHQAAVAEPPDPVEQIQSVRDLLLATEEHRRVGLLEGHQTRVGRAFAIPEKHARRVESRVGNPAEQPVIGLVLADRDVHHLVVGQNPVELTVLDLDGEEVLAQCTGMGDLHEAPARQHGALAAEHDHGAAGPNTAVQGLLPGLAGLDAIPDIGVEEDRTFCGCPSWTRRSRSSSAAARSLLLWLMKIRLTGRSVAITGASYSQEFAVAH